MRQLALEAGHTFRDSDKPYHVRAAALLMILILASPFAVVATIAIFILANNLKKQTELFAEAIAQERADRREVAATASRERMELEQRMLLREERNTAIITSTMKELTRAVDRNTEAVTGKRFIQPTPKAATGGTK